MIRLRNARGGTVKTVFLLPFLTEQKIPCKLEQKLVRVQLRRQPITIVDSDATRSQSERADSAAVAREKGWFFPRAFFEGMRGWNLMWPVGKVKWRGQVRADIKVTVLCQEVVKENLFSEAEVQSRISVYGSKSHFSLVCRLLITEVILLSQSMPYGKHKWFCS